MDRRITLLAVVAFVFSAATAEAQKGDGKVTQLVPDDLKGPSKRQEGWDGTLSIAANLSIAQNRKVVGQLDGTSFVAGGALVGTLEYHMGSHELMNVLSITESYAKTPALDPLVKTNDVARLESIYSYYLTDWVGTFGRLSFETSIFRANDYRAEAVDFAILRQDGTTELRSSQTSLRLSGAFKPFTMTQSVGMVAKPVDKEQFAMTARLGIGGRETLAKGVLVNSDDNATAVVEMTETDDVVQAGLEFALGFAGKFPEERVSYGLDAGVLFPLLNNDDQDRSAVDLMRIGVTGAVTFSTFDWLSLVYQLRILSDPQLTEEVQVQNNILFSLKYDLIQADKPPEEAPPPSPELQKALDEAKEANDRAIAAEERAKAAEEKAKALEQSQPSTTPPSEAPPSETGDTPDPE